MAGYSLRVKPAAAKEIDRIRNRRDRLRIVARIRALATEPRPPGCRKLSARDLYRVRQGVYRILYTVEDAVLTVEVVRVGHRRAVYRR